MFIIRRRTFLGAAAGTIAAAYSPIIRAQQSATVRIGFSGPLSGPLESVGKPFRLGAEIARDQVNAAGGVLGKKLELVVLDDHGDATQAVANMREFSSTNTKQAIGLPMTATAMASAAVLPELKISVLGDGSPELKLTHELYNRNYFNTAENTYMRGNAFGDAMAQRFPDVTVWAAAVFDAAAGRDAWESSKYGLKKFYKERLNKDVTMIDALQLKPSGSDFKGAISQLVASPATGLIMIMPGAAGITMYQQGEQFGLSKRFKVINDQSLDIDVCKALKQNVPPNLWVTSFWYPDAFKQYKESVDLAAEIEKRTGDLPHGFSSLSHINVHAWALAIAKAGTTETDTVIAALEGMQMNTCKGPGYFRKEDHQFISGTCLFNVKPKDSPPGFQTNDVVSLNADTDHLANPATPGTPFKI